MKEMKKKRKGTGVVRRFLALMMTAAIVVGNIFSSGAMDVKAGNQIRSINSDYEGMLYEMISMSGDIACFFDTQINGPYLMRNINGHNPNFYSYCIDKNVSTKIGTQYRAVPFSEANYFNGADNSTYAHIENKLKTIVKAVDGKTDNITRYAAQMLIWHIVHGGEVYTDKLQKHDRNSPSDSMPSYKMPEVSAYNGEHGTSDRYYATYPGLGRLEHRWSGGSLRSEGITDMTGYGSNGAVSQIKITGLKPGDKVSVVEKTPDSYGRFSQSNSLSDALTGQVWEDVSVGYDGTATISMYPTVSYAIPGKYIRYKILSKNYWIYINGELYHSNPRAFIDKKNKFLYSKVYNLKWFGQPVTTDQIISPDIYNKYNELDSIQVKDYASEENFELNAVIDNMKYKAHNNQTFNISYDLSAQSDKLYDVAVDENSITLKYYVVYKDNNGNTLKEVIYPNSQYKDVVKRGSKWNISADFNASVLDKKDAAIKVYAGMKAGRISDPYKTAVLALVSVPAGKQNLITVGELPNEKYAETETLFIIDKAQAKINILKLEAGTDELLGGIGDKEVRLGVYDAQKYDLNKVNDDNYNDLTDEAIVQLSDGTRAVKTIMSSSDRFDVTLKPGKYILHEIKAPSGYKQAGDIEFEVTKDGKVVGKDGVELALDDKIYTIKMYDEFDEGETEISVKKEWKVPSDAFKKDSVKVALYADNVEIKTKELNASNNWSTSFEKLPEFNKETKAKIVYKIKEVGEEAYLYNGDNGIVYDVNYKSDFDKKSYTIENSYKEEKVGLEIVKKWEGQIDKNATVMFGVYNKQDLTKRLGTPITLKQADAKSDDPNTWVKSTGDVFDKHNPDGTLAKYVVRELDSSTGTPLPVDNHKIVKIGDTRYVVDYENDNTVRNKAIEETEITVIKKWSKTLNDDAPKDIDSITVRLYKDGVAKAIEEVKLNASNKWTHTFTKLDKLDFENQPIKYYVREVVNGNDVADKSVFVMNNRKYTSTYSNAGSINDGTVTITNTFDQEKIDIDVVKKWIYSDSYKDVKENDITVQLYADGQLVNNRTVTLSTNNGWYGKFTKLDKFNASGELVKYTVKEVNENNKVYQGANDRKYIVEYKNTGNSFTIENKFNEEKIELEVVKQWIGKVDKDAAVKLAVYNSKDLSTAITTLDLNAQSADSSNELLWKASTGKILPKHNTDGTLAKYEVREVYTTDSGTVVPVQNKQVVKIGSTRYQVNYTGALKVANKALDETQIKVIKKWVGTPNNDNPTDIKSIKVNLYKAGSNDVFKSVELSDDNNWTATFDKLDKYDDNMKLIKYVVKEVVNGKELNNNDTVVSASGRSYVATYSNPNEIESGDVTITNTFKNDKVKVLVNKVWAKKNAPKEKYVEVALLADGKATAQTAILSATNGWSAKFEELDKYDAKTNEEIKYTVVEKGVSDDNGQLVFIGTDSKKYNVKYDTVKTTEGFKCTITNDFIEEKVKLEAIKKWNGELESGVTIKLGVYNVNAPDKLVKDMTLSASNAKSGDAKTWAQTADLPKHNADGSLAQYFVRELKTVNGKDVVVKEHSIVKVGSKRYEVSYTDSNTIENKELEKTSLRVVKKWANTPLNKSPEGIDSITVKLYRADTNACVAKQKLDDKYGWEHEFTGLDKLDDNKQEIKYIVKEVVNGKELGNDSTFTNGTQKYTVTMSNKDKAVSGGNVVTITNKFNDEKVSLDVTKKWVGDIQEESVLVKVMNGSQVVDTATLNAENNWSAEFTKLPKHDPATLKEITYSVAEDGEANLVYTGTDGRTYDVKYKANADKTKFTITNEFRKEFVKLEVTKQWKGKVDDNASIKLGVVNVNEPNKVIKDVTLNNTTTTDSWSATFDKLDKHNADGTLAKYEVRELNADGKIVNSGKIVKVGTGRYVVKYINGNTVLNERLDETEISVIKVWDGVSNNGPSDINSITVKLYRADNDKPVATEDLTKANGWQHTFTGLDKIANDGKTYIKYYVKEFVNGKVVDNNDTFKLGAHKYTATYSSTESNPVLSGDIRITNTFKNDKVKVSVVKKWANSNIKHEDYVTVALLANGTLLDTVTLNDANNWKAVFTDLDKYDANQNLIEYTVVEQGASRSGSGIVYNGTDNKVYDVKYDVDKSDAKTAKWTITNDLREEKVKVEVRKLWNGKLDDNVSIKLGIYNADTKKQVKVLTLTSKNVDSDNANAWVKSAELPKHNADGTLAKYYVRELKENNGELVAIDGGVVKVGSRRYEVIYSGSTTVENHEMDETSLKVVKDWENTPLNKAPSDIDSIKVKLYRADTNKVVAEATLDASNNWSATFERLEKQDDNKNDIKYYVKEVVNGTELGNKDIFTNGDHKYTVTISNDGQPINTGIIKITNRFENEKVNLKVVKEWIGDIKEKSVYVKLLADGQVREIVTLSGDNSWSHEFKNLPKFSDLTLKEIKYTVEEAGTVDLVYTAANGRKYDVKYDDSTNNTVKITNKFKQEYVDLEVAKQWIGNVSLDDKVVLGVYNKKSNDRIQKLEITGSSAASASKWAAKASDLPKYNADGTLAKYEVKELKLNSTGDYVPIKSNKIVKVGDGRFVVKYLKDTVVTNERLDETEISVVKLWKGTKNDAAPSEIKSIDVKLYRADNDRVVDKATLSGDNNWKHTFTKLDKIADDGSTIKYYVREFVNATKLEDGDTFTNGSQKYTVTYSNTAGLTDGEIRITNTFDKQYVDLSVDKKWSDNKAGEKSVQVTLYADDVATTKTATLNADNGWHAEFKKLPKHNDNMQEIKYEIKEQGEVNLVFEGADGRKYDVEYSKSGNNFVVTNKFKEEKTELEVIKKWIGKVDENAVVKIGVYNEKNPTVAVATLTLDKNSGSNGVWTAKATGLPKHNADRTLAKYFVAEYRNANPSDPITSDSSNKITKIGDTRYEVSFDGKTTIVNKELEKTSITVVKNWVGTDVSTIDSITVKLYTQLGQFVDSQTLNAQNGWKHTFNNLEKYDDNMNVIKYLVKEEVNGKDLNNNDKFKLGTHEYTVTYSSDDAIEAGTVTITNTFNNEKVKVIVDKKWAVENMAKERFVKVALVANQAATGRVAILNADNKWHAEFTGLDKYDDNQKLIEYTVVEADTSTDASGKTIFTGSNGKIYDVAYSVNNDEKDTSNWTITNTYREEKVKVTATKKWAGKLEDGVSIKLGVYNIADMSKPVTVMTLTSSDASDAKTWVQSAKLPKHNLDGTKAQYTVRELDSTKGDKKLEAYDVVKVGKTRYEVTYQGTTTVTNTEIENTSIKVIKKWANTPNGKAPKGIDSITVKLYRADSNEFVAEKVLNDANDWQDTFTGLQKTDDSNKNQIKYVVKEVVNDQEYGNGDTITYGTQKYTVTYSDSGAALNYGTVTITNEFKEENVELTVVKKWEGAYKEKEVVVKLLADGQVVDTHKLNEKNNWTYTFKNLPKHSKLTLDDIKYTIEEDGVGADFVYTGVSGKKYTVTSVVANDITTITNKAFEQTEVKVVKKWAPAGKAPTDISSITVALYRSDKADAIKTATLTANNGWSFTFDKLDKKDMAGNEIKYFVKEVVNGKALDNNTEFNYGKNTYTVTYSNSTGVTGGEIVITNTQKDEKVELKIVKRWEGKVDDNAIIYVGIFNEKALNNVVKTMKLNYTKNAGTDNGATIWADKATDLPKFDSDNNEIVYVVRELKPVGDKWAIVENNEIIKIGDGSYKVSYPANDKTTLINKRQEDEKTTINVIKYWRNADGTETAPSTIKSIDVVLYNGLTNVEVATVTLNADNGWQHSFGELEKYDAQKNLITYYVKEKVNGQVYEDGSTIDIGNAKYVVSYIENNKAKGYIGIANKEKHEDTGITVVKKWSGVDLSVAPAIKVQLFGSDGKTNSDVVTLDKNNGFRHVFNGLKARDDSGNKITYEVRELGAQNGRIVIDGVDYSVNYAIDGLTTTITNARTPDSGRTKLPFKKVWNVTDDVVMPADIEVYLVSRVKDSGNDWKEVEGTRKTITAANGWAGEYDNLVLVDDKNQKLEYDVREKQLNNFATTYSWDASGTVRVIINSRGTLLRKTDQDRLGAGGAVFELWGYKTSAFTKNTDVKATPTNTGTSTNKTPDANATTGTKTTAADVAAAANSNNSSATDNKLLEAARKMQEDSTAVVKLPIKVSYSANQIIDNFYTTARVYVNDVEAASKTLTAGNISDIIEVDVKATDTIRVEFGYISRTVKLDDGSTKYVFTISNMDIDLQNMSFSVPVVVDDDALVAYNEAQNRSANADTDENKQGSESEDNKDKDAKVEKETDSSTQSLETKNIEITTATGVEGTESTGIEGTESTGTDSTDMPEAEGGPVEEVTQAVESTGATEAGSTGAEETVSSGDVTGTAFMVSAVNYLAPVAMSDENESIIKSADILLSEMLQTIIKANDGKTKEDVPSDAKMELLGTVTAEAGTGVLDLNKVAAMYGLDVLPNGEYYVIEIQGPDARSNGTWQSFDSGLKFSFKILNGQIAVDESKNTGIRIDKDNAGNIAGYRIENIFIPENHVPDIPDPRIPFIPDQPTFDTPDKPTTEIPEDPTPKIPTPDVVIPEPPLKIDDDIIIPDDDVPLSPILPKTGDSAGSFIMMSMAGVALGGLLLTKKKKRAQ